MGNSIESEPIVSLDALQRDRLTLVWGNPWQPLLGSDEWVTFLDLEGWVFDSKDLKERILYGGMEYSLYQEAWKFLLGHYKFDSTYGKHQYIASTKKKEYQIIKS